jgi:hypothetical protein
MPAPSWETLDDFLSPDEFGIAATVSLQGGATREVVGIFDDAFMNAELGEYELDTTQPRLLVKAIDAAGIARGDEVTIDGETFDVLTSPQGDGTGWATLVMARRHP